MIARVVKVNPFTEVVALDQRTRVNLLYDCYGSLLTPRQREALACYYGEDWSLAEVAEHLGTSRPAVQDLLRRAQASMEGYEAHLRLLERQARREEVLDQVRQLLRPHLDQPGVVEAWAWLKEI